MHALLMFGTREITFAGAIFVRPLVDRVNLAIWSGGGRKQNRGAGKVPPDLQNISGRRFYRLPQQGRFIEALPNQAAVSAVAGKKPRQILKPLAGF